MRVKSTFDSCLKIPKVKRRLDPQILALCETYKFWIAFADIDGFRVDTVKHMDLGATRIFTSVIHEFAQSIEKGVGSKLEL